MRLLRRTTPPVLALAGFAAASGAPPETAVKDADLGLSRTSVFEVPAPAPVVEDATAPGERPRRPRAYPGEPPRIPHGIADLGPITRDDHPCLLCHQGPPAAPAEEGEPTPIPLSHYVDLRHAPDRPGDTLVGARYVCTACHLPLTDAAPLIGNRFAEREGGRGERATPRSPQKP